MLQFYFFGVGYAKIKSRLKHTGFHSSPSSMDHASDDSSMIFLRYMVMFCVLAPIFSGIPFFPFWGTFHGRFYKNRLLKIRTVMINKTISIIQSKPAFFRTRSLTITSIKTTTTRNRKDIIMTIPLHPPVPLRLTAASTIPKMATNIAITQGEII